MGLQSDDIFEPPQYDAGPFRFFLWIAHREGLAYLLRFVNFASERWAEQVRKLPAESGEISEVTVPSDGGPKQLFGCWRMYSANRDAPWIHAGVRAALMAMEIWLKALHVLANPGRRPDNAHLERVEVGGFGRGPHHIGQTLARPALDRTAAVGANPRVAPVGSPAFERPAVPVERRQTFGKNAGEMEATRGGIPPAPADLRPRAA